jgi:[acyl-carrier-protein] S-malonyltransferase
MGRDVAGSFESASRLYRRADEVLGFDLSGLCFEGPAERLNTTAASQPAIFVTSAAILAALRDRCDGSITPQAAAGLSLGEYTALYAAGILGFEEALVLCAKRGRAMQAAADSRPGAMVSIIGLEAGQVESICEKAAEGEVLKPANFNCPGQVVVSGTESACRRVERLAPEYGAIKAIRLEVAGAFHTDMMSEAAGRLKEAIDNTPIGQPGPVKVMANVDAEFYTGPEAIADGLLKQLTSPILWQKSMEKLLSAGIERFYEIGPGKVLTGLMKRIDRRADILAVNGLAALENIA